MSASAAYKPPHAGRPTPVKAADSARWCAHCQAWGDHHTDRHRAELD